MKGALALVGAIWFATGLQVRAADAIRQVMWKDLVPAVERPRTPFDGLPVEHQIDLSVVEVGRREPNRLGRMSAAQREAVENARAARRRTPGPTRSVGWSSGRSTARRFASLAICCRSRPATER